MFDIGVTALVGALEVPPVIANSRHVALDLALLGVATVAIAVRRTWPLPVFGWVLGVSAAAGLIDPRAVAGPAVLVGVYTVAAICPRRTAFWSATLAEIGAVAAAVVVGGASWWLTAIFLSGMVAAALGLGLYMGTRRAYLAELQDRANRLEHDRDQQVELASAAERARIARDLHDIVAHHLTVMVALSDGAVAAAGGASAQVAEAMQMVSATGRQALADTRRLLGVLREDDNAHRDQDDGSHRDSALALPSLPMTLPTRPVARQPLPDVGDLDALIDRVRAAGLPVVYEVTGRPNDLPPAVQLTVYRLVQESLTNTLKHAGDSARAVVRLRAMTGRVVIEVHDDGRPAAAAAAPPGRGLTGMRERVQAYGGQVQAGPGVDGGWQVVASLRMDGGAQ